MSRRRGMDRGLRLQQLATLALVALTALLAAHTLRTVREVASFGAPIGADQVRSGLGERQQALVDEMDGRRERVAAAAAPDRDPFQAVVREAAPAPAPAPRARPAVPVTPALRALVYDDTQPVVRIDVGGRSSGWLSRGETFSGWTVLEVKPASARVSNGSRIFELRLN
jgi:hypothetical protein